MIRKLKKGDKIAVVSLSSGMLGKSFLKHYLEKGLENMKLIDFEVVMMQTLLKE